MFVFLFKNPCFNDYRLCKAVFPVAVHRSFSDDSVRRKHLNDKISADTERRAGPSATTDICHTSFRNVLLLSLSCF